jgi:fused signal recognition particle receptor
MAAANSKKKRPRKERKEQKKLARKATSEELETSTEREPDPSGPPAPMPEEPSLEPEELEPDLDLLEPDPSGPPAPSGEDVIFLESAETGEKLEEEPEEEFEYEEAEDEEEEKKYRRGFFRSRKVLSKPFTRAAMRRAIDPEFWDDAEEALITADTGVTCATEIVERSRKRILKEGVKDLEGLKQVFREEVADMLESFGPGPAPPAEKPHVLFVVGVNGVGKTTTSAKIGWQLKQQDKAVLFAAADTFRAAGIEQMEMWAQRVGSPVVRHKLGGDPAAVVFDAIESAQAKGTDVVIVDTAGRLHTKKNLMDELNKMWRVADRQLETSPEAILVIDATTGQNGVTQARVFGEALNIGSIALTKMDGSAKGGVVMAIGRELGIPVAYIGVGEGMADLRPFNPQEYAHALF